MQMIMAYGEHKRWENKKIGGPGVEIETDVFQLGKKPKNGQGERRLNKCYIQAIAERGGDVLFEVFPNPSGGPEALFQISGPLDRHLLPFTIIISDGVRALEAYCGDRRDKDFVHCIINHSEVNEHGFTWILYVDSDDGVGFEGLVDGKYRLIRVGNILTP